MISKLKHHNELKNYIRMDEKYIVWHRVYSFHEKTIDQPTLARHLESTMGLRLMAETNQDGERGKVTPETLHGFLTTSKITPFADGVCSWCREQTQAGTQHTCVIITLFETQVKETEETHTKLERSLQDYQ